MATKRVSKKKQLAGTCTAIVLRQSDALAAPAGPAKRPRAPRRVVPTVHIEFEPFKRSSDSIGDAREMSAYRGHEATVEGWALTCKRCKRAGLISEAGYEGELFEGSRGCADEDDE